MVDPRRYPVSSDALYEPPAHTLEDALAFESSVGLDKIVLVQPSIYATDNTCLLEALKTIGPSRGYGVVVIDPSNAPLPMLKDWDALGVRAVRINLKSVGKVMTPDQLRDTLIQQANVIRPLGWVIQVFLPLDLVPSLEEIVPQLGVKVCVDHFGGPDLSSISWDNSPSSSSSFDPYSLPGFSSLVSLAQRKMVYVKLSAPYRFSKDNQMRDIRAMALELLHVAPDRVIFATDWPHTRFEGVNIAPYMESCLEWCGNDPDLIERLFKRNSEEMFAKV